MSKWLIVVLWLMALETFALQSRIAEDDISVDFNISQQELTHIVIENDRILGAKSARDNLAIEREETLGHLFIKPHAAVREPIQLFLITEQGKTLELRLTPEDLPGETIKIYTDEAMVPTISTSLSLENTLADLILALYQKTPLPGYTSVKPESEPFLLPKLVAYETTRLVGDTWVAIEYAIQNPNYRTVRLQESDFYTPAVKAVAIEHKKLFRNHSTRVYVVKEL